MQRGIYREALAELLANAEVSQDHMVEFFKEELRKALKQAVIADQMAMRCHASAKSESV